MIQVLLSAQQRKALDVLLAGGDKPLAAQAARVNPRTLRKWMHDPAFLAALTAAQDATLDAVTDSLVRAASGAVALLDQTRGNEDAPLTLRLQAARTLLDAALRWRELRGIERRLDALEQALHETPTTIDQVGGSNPSSAGRAAGDTGR